MSAEDKYAALLGDVPNEDCSDWDTPVPQAEGPACAFVPGKKKKQAESKEQLQKEIAKDPGLVGALISVAVSIPALVGSWCWPVLLLGLMGTAASAGAKAMSHSISFGVTLAVLTNLTQLTFAGSKRRKNRSHWNKYGPTYLVGMSIPLVMADLTRHVLQDAGMWGNCVLQCTPAIDPTQASYDCPGSAMYRPNCDVDGIRCLSTIGWVFTVLFTYSGFACLVVGTLWSADLHLKIKKAYNLARGNK